MAPSLTRASGRCIRLVPMNLRDRLVLVALEWQRRYGVAPHITAQLSEYDAARLVGMPEDEYSQSRQRDTAVKKGHDFIFNGIRYQIKANRPSGKQGSRVTLVGKARNYEWDRLIWILTIRCTSSRKRGSGASTRTVDTSQISVASDRGTCAKGARSTAYRPPHRCDCRRRPPVHCTPSWMTFAARPRCFLSSLQEPSSAARSSGCRRARPRRPA